MIPNVTPGETASGVMAYLVGPGTVEEHISPHLVAGSAPLMAWYSNADLSHDDALEIASELEQSRRVTGVDVAGGHVWHCSLSLHERDGVKSDEDWEAMATDFMKEMGFVGVEGKADTPWVVVRHGLSGTNGNDHVHIVASLVREDGTKADNWNDFPRAQAAARVMETRYGLLPVMPGQGAMGYKKGEVQAAKERGRLEPERVTLARMVRAYATESETEGEFVRRCRRGGLMIKPRFTSEKMDEVSGFAVGMKPPKGFRPIYYAGGKLARDLTLGVLRDEWQTPAGAREEALAEWQAAKFGKRQVIDNGRETAEPDPELTDRVADQLAELRDRLRSIPFDNHEEYRRTAAFLSGAYASWSLHTEPVPGELARVADELSKSAQVSRTAYRRVPPEKPMSVYSATALALAASGSGAGAQLAVFVHLSKLAETIMKFNQARRNEVREISMMKMATSDLRLVSERMHELAGPKPRRVKSNSGVPVVENQKSVVGPKLTANQTSGPKVSR